CLYFFFQAEDGIRDFHVTGVQTCALSDLSRNTPLSSKARTSLKLTRANPAPPPTKALVPFSSPKSNRPLSMKLSERVDPAPSRVPAGRAPPLAGKLATLVKPSTRARL